MADKDLERGERPKHERPDNPPEPQEDARPNSVRSKDDRGSDANRSGSESGGGD